MLDRKASAGFAFNNVASVVSVEAALDGGARTIIPVDNRGRFALPKCPAGQHSLTLTVTKTISPLPVCPMCTVSGGLILHQHHPLPRGACCSSSLARSMSQAVSRDMGRRCLHWPCILDSRT